MSGRLPEQEVTILDKQHNAAEQQHQVVIPPLICIVDEKEHARRRRPWSKGFNTSALKGYESLVMKRTLQLAEMLLLKNLKQAVNLTSWIEFLGYASDHSPCIRLS